ncbi:hypothetical protein PGTUg99_003060 [Puccinia graminis f. sp. tritici]|uniref:Uncharacterized protein n=1 Tax=Puccinia graminis f. sp. tritici TaxID=56615 RepID=A0A5B0S2Y4_PUCGR|nr:hypothetical protein PGTUg99_003060 [Puccinia graminis f. sp. tritici]
MNMTALKILRPSKSYKHTETALNQELITRASTKKPIHHSCSNPCLPNPASKYNHPMNVVRSISDTTMIPNPPQNLTTMEHYPNRLPIRVRSSLGQAFIFYANSSEHSQP